MNRRFKKTMTLVLSMLFCLSVFASPVFAAKPVKPSTGSVAGVVKNSAGQAIAGATVKTDSGGYTATTDSTGKYTLAGLATGSYSLTASATGYKAGTKSVTVYTSTTTVADFSLTQEATVPSTVTYTTTHIFSINDIQGDADKTATSFGTSCLDLTRPVVDSKDGLTYFAVDNAFGYNVQDFVGATEKPRDGLYKEGWVANIYDNSGNVIGLKAKNVAPNEWYVATPLTGEWNVDANGVKTKASSEHYLTMDHWINVPGAPPLVYGVDYRARFKDDGKKLYMWGNLNSEPTDLRFYARMSLPEAWKAPDANYTVKSAKLVVTHLLAGSPNDQLRPEDLENENATGILPRYNVQKDGSWTASVDSTHGDDGHPCPVGTSYKLASPILVPNVDEYGQPLKDFWGNPVTEPDVVYYTGDWFTTMDRDPFAGVNPRWRLKAATFGQDLASVAIPWYKSGEYTTTTIDLLAPMNDEVTGALIPSALTKSTGWFNYMDESDGVLDGYSIEGIPMTKDLDLAYYVKGTLAGQVLYNAKLIIEYEDPNGTSTPTGNDVAIGGLTAPTSVKMGAPANITVAVKNNMPGAASGTLTLTGKDTKGKTYVFSSPFTTSADNSATNIVFNWIAPTYTTTVNWSATVTAADDLDSSNNSVTATTKVTR